MSDHQKYTREYERLQAERNVAVRELEQASQERDKLAKELELANKTGELTGQLLGSLLAKSRDVVSAMDEYVDKANHGNTDITPLWNSIIRLGHLVRLDEAP